MLCRGPAGRSLGWVPQPHGAENGETRQADLAADFCYTAQGTGSLPASDNGSAAVSSTVTELLSPGTVNAGLDHALLGAVLCVGLLPITLDSTH